MRRCSLAILALIFCLTSCKAPPAAPPETLTEARQGFKTVLTSQPQWEAATAVDPPQGVFEKIQYDSPAGSLEAYITPDPKDGVKHPAVVWCHGGFGGIDSWFWEPADPANDQSASAFREAGLVLMIPSWRGENDNPGDFELFYGEVDDVLAAVKYARSLPYVDPNRVYLAGHSTGGTLALLAAEASDQFRAVFSFGGAPDVAAVLNSDGGYGNTPFDLKRADELRLRNPLEFVSSIERPTFYFEGEDSFYPPHALQMEQKAEALGVPFKAYILPGEDHFSILHPLTKLVAAKILADTGEKCNIEFTREELAAAAPPR